MSSWGVMQVGMPSLNDGFLFKVIAQEKAVSITVTASTKKTWCQMQGTNSPSAVMPNLFAKYGKPKNAPVEMTMPQQRNVAMAQP